MLNHSHEVENSHYFGPRSLAAYIGTEWGFLCYGAKFLANFSTLSNLWIALKYKHYLGILENLRPKSVKMFGFLFNTNLTQKARALEIDAPPCPTFTTPLCIFTMDVIRIMKPFKMFE